jgi:hypothetical protein
MLLDCLEVVIAGQPVAVPTLAVERVAELEVCGPPPLCEPWVGGLGRSALDLVVTLSLAGPAAASAGPARQTTALLLRAPVSRTRWGIEIQRVVGFCQVDQRSMAPASPPGWPCPAGWLLAEGGAAPTRLLLDPAALHRSLADAASPTEAA